MVLFMYRSLSVEDAKRMAAQGVVVLSPHFDDGCFSLGGLLREVGQGTLINVFNRSMHLPKQNVELSGQDAEAQAAMVRGQEDQAFAELCGLERCQLDGSEPGFWGRRPSDLGGLAQDVQAMEGAVLDALSAHADPAGARPWLMVPMAVGRHVNHHAVHEIVRLNRDRLESAFRLGFYEDLPYAHDPVARGQALQRFQTQWGPRLQRCTWRVSWPDKMALISLYASQHRRKPSWLKYRPAALWPLHGHEALWTDPRNFSQVDA